MSEIENKTIIIVGGGSGGLGCAIYAASCGLKVFLIEKTSRLGGTVTQSLIHTIGGLYDHKGEYLLDGLPIELAESLIKASPYSHKRKIGKVWTLSVDPLIYEKIIETRIADKTNITLLRNSLVTNVRTDGNAVTQVTILTDNKQITVQPSALVDATGTAEIVKMVDPEKVVDGHALAGLIFQIKNVNSESLKFPKNISILREIKKAAEQGVIPVECSNTWLDTGVYEDEIYVKLNMPANTDIKINYIRDTLLDFLKKFPAFSNSKLGLTGNLGIRDAARIKGQYHLTADDVKNGRKFSDAVCRCCWPIEYWDPRQGVILEYLPENQYYEIPLRALQVNGINNLWAVGKCLCSDELAQSSARVVGSCWAMGEGLAKYLVCK